MTTPTDGGTATRGPGSPRVVIEDPRTAEVRSLIGALDDYLAALYPPQNNYLLDVEALCAPEVTFFVARVGGMALGCGALRVRDAHCGEIKRMYVAPEARGLYREAGFRPCGAFADYREDPLNLFMEKPLGRGARAH